MKGLARALSLPGVPPLASLAVLFALWQIAARAIGIEGLPSATSVIALDVSSAWVVGTSNR